MGIVSTHLIFLFILTIRRMKEVTEGLRKVLGRKLNGGWPANMKRLMGVAHHPMMWLIIQTRAVTLFKWPEALFQPHLWLATSPSPGQERVCYPIFVSHSELKWGRVFDHSNALMFAMYHHPHWQERRHSIQHSHRTRTSKQWPTGQTLPAACFGKYVVLMEDSHASSLTHWAMEDFTLPLHSWEAVSDNIRLTKPSKMFTTWPFKKCARSCFRRIRQCS